MDLSQKDLFSAPAGAEDPRQHSQALDELLGFNVAAIEECLLSQAREINPDGSHHNWGQSLHQGNQTWVGLSHQTLQTPYSELKEMCELLKPDPGQLVVDLGAGYGRMGLVLAGLYPLVSFIGYEYVSQRVEEGNRIFKKLGCENSQLLEQDLTADNFELPEADFYLIYDFGTVAHIRYILKQVAAMAEKRNFKVIGRGKGTQSLIEYEHPWLSDIYPVIRRENFSIYSMAST